MSVFQEDLEGQQVRQLCSFTLEKNLTSYSPVAVTLRQLKTKFLPFSQFANVVSMVALLLY